MKVLKALVRIPIGKGQYLALFLDSIVREYYSEVDGEMTYASELFRFEKIKNFIMFKW